LTSLHIYWNRNIPRLHPPLPPGFFRKIQGPPDRPVSPKAAAHSLYKDFYWHPYREFRGWEPDPFPYRWNTLKVLVREHTVLPPVVPLFPGHVPALPVPCGFPLINHQTKLSFLEGHLPHPPLVGGCHPGF